MKSDILILAALLLAPLEQFTIGCILAHSWHGHLARVHGLEGRATRSQPFVKCSSCLLQPRLRPRGRRAGIPGGLKPEPREAVEAAFR